MVVGIFLGLAGILIFAILMSLSNQEAKSDKSPYTVVPSKDRQEDKAKDTKTVDLSTITEEEVESFAINEAEQILDHISFDKREIDDHIFDALIGKLMETGDEYIDNGEAHQLSVIHGMSPGRVHGWFKQKKKYRRYIYPFSYKYAAAKIGLKFEDQLLDELNYIQSHELDEWYRNRKRQGYFFTSKVFDKINEIKNS